MKRLYELDIDFELLKLQKKTLMKAITHYECCAKVCHNPDPDNQKAKDLRTILQVMDEIQDEAVSRGVLEEDVFPTELEVEGYVRVFNTGSPYTPEGQIIYACPVTDTKYGRITVYFRDVCRMVDGFADIDMSLEKWLSERNEEEIARLIMQQYDKNLYRAGLANKAARPEDPMQEKALQLIESKEYR